MRYSPQEFVRFARNIKRRVFAHSTIAAVRSNVPDSIGSEKPWKQNIFVPALELYVKSPDHPFMEYSTCSAADLMHPRYIDIARRLNIPLLFHRKNWEFAFIFHQAESRGLARDGTRGLGFAVGREPLPAAFAKAGMSITATDAPIEIGVAQGWSGSGQFVTSIDDLVFVGIVDPATLRSRVQFESCDMNAISPHLTGYDFCWSACALEHLGSIQRGLDFITYTVENCLKIGGVACHTTEFNLSSNNVTIETGGTVLYRYKDLKGLIDELRLRGHRVDELKIAPDAHHLDSYVDTPPYSDSPHLKLALQGYTATSVGLVITRGR